MAILMGMPMKRQALDPALLAWTLFLAISPAAAATGPATALERYFAALRANNREALQAALAPDYRYDGVDGAVASAVFDGPLGIRYRTLYTRIEAMTRVGEVATATAFTIFQGNVNLEFVGRGRPLVNGTTRLVVELSPRGGEWRVTAVRVVRGVYVAPGREAPHLFEVTVNDRTSLRVTPGAELRITGQVFGASRLLVFLGERTGAGAVDPDFVNLWRLTMPAPGAPGRYLFHAVAYSDDLLALEHVTLPVTVQEP